MTSSTGSGETASLDSSSTAVLDGSSTDTGMGSDSSTGGVCGEGCPDQQHCEAGECVWDEGATIWTETFDTVVPGGPDSANAVAIDSQDEIVLVGNLATADRMGLLIPDAYDVIVRKYDVDGGLLWSQTRPQGVGADVTISTADEPFVAIGAFGPGAESAAGYDAAGNPMWALVDTGAIADGIEIAPDGSYFIVGWVPGDVPWAAKYTTMGSVEWQANQMGQTGRHRRVQLSPDGMALGLVGSNVDGTGLVREWLQTWPVDPGTGNPEMAPTVDLPWVSSMEIAAAYANGIGFMDNGDMVVAGNELTPVESWNITLTRYAPDGSVVWRESYNNPADAPDGGFGVAVDSQQNIIVVGGGQRPDLMQGSNAWIGKYDPDGLPIWTRDHDEAGLDDTARDVAVDSADNIVVVGYVDADDGNGSQLWIRKYAP